MDDYYREIILEHYKRPSFRGHIPNATISHEEDNPLCGDRIRVELLVEDGIVKDARFSGQGCAISQASASLLTDEIKGKPVDTAAGITSSDVLELLGIEISPARMKCALLSLDTLQHALADEQAPVAPTEPAS